MSSFQQICSIFCCPPFPKRIAAKLAFVPPPASYSIADDIDNYVFYLTEDARWQFSQRELLKLEGFYTQTKRGNKIACVYVNCSSSAKFTILYSHGNAVDLGHMTSLFLGLGTLINCNVFSYDYSGYGASTGTPSEKNLYADIDAAWFVLRTKYHVKPDRIILYGQSIGTVPTVDLATRIQVAGVVLHSPLMSGMRVLCPKTKRTWICDSFAVIDKVEKILAPTLIIHGKQDTTIDFSHAQKIFEKCRTTVEPLWVEEAGHDDLDCSCEIYLERLRFFVNVELNKT